MTIELTQEQLDRAAKANSLWIQGGTVTDPILNQLYPGEYGFGALRCAIDNLNGDNVEWISYPSGAEHVFCYAYYVKPPPTSGTIVIRKQEEGVPGGATETFSFDGNLSFNPGGSFNIALNNQESNSAPPFYRAAGQTWTVRELVTRRLGAHRHLVRQDGDQHHRDEPGRGSAEHCPGGGRQGGLHVHEHTPPTGGPAVHPQDHLRGSRVIRLRRVPHRGW